MMIFYENVKSSVEIDSWILLICDLAISNENPRLKSKDRHPGLLEEQYRISSMQGTTSGSDFNYQ